jgi:DNA-binding GntR family transcriptional regulator
MDNLSAHMRRGELGLQGKELRKHDVAERLLAEIVNGSLRPGEQISERTWAQKFGVAQASIREAINILGRDGFVTKESGHSARVVHLSDKDVVQLYEIRGALEGLAAYLAASSQPDLSKMDAIVNDMQQASEINDSSALVDLDLNFHLELCNLSGNPHLLEQAHRILLPFFAFVRVRVATAGQGTSTWGRDIETHQRIVELLRNGDAEFAQYYVRKAMVRFADTARKNWI